MKSMFIDVTPVLVHYNGYRFELGIVRYEVDTNMWAEIEQESFVNTIQQLTPPVMVGDGIGFTKIEFLVRMSNGDKPQANFVTPYPPELLEKIQKNAEYGQEGNVIKEGIVIKDGIDTEAIGNGEQEPLRSEWAN